MTLVERFVDWSNGKRGPKIISGFMPSYNFNIDAFLQLSQWNERVFGERIKALPLGGLKMRPDAEMRRWLLARQAAGVELTSASFVGIGDVHDRWNGRRGDYEFLRTSFASPRRSEWRLTRRFSCKEQSAFYRTHSEIHSRAASPDNVHRLPTIFHRRPWSPL